jgi:hypothetical protein
MAETADSVSDVAVKNKKFQVLVIHNKMFKVFYLPNDAQQNCFKKNIKIYIKTAPTSFGAITIIRERIIRTC